LDITIIVYDLELAPITNAAVLQYFSLHDLRRDRGLPHLLLMIL
jgi:hypothetical protein